MIKWNTAKYVNRCTEFSNFFSNVSKFRVSFSPGTGFLTATCKYHLSLLYLLICNRFVNCPMSKMLSSFSMLGGLCSSGLRINHFNLRNHIQYMGLKKTKYTDQNSLHVPKRDVGRQRTEISGCLVWVSQRHSWPVGKLNVEAFNLLPRPCS